MNPVDLPPLVMNKRTCVVLVNPIKISSVVVEITQITLGIVSWYRWVFAHFGFFQFAVFSETVFKFIFLWFLTKYSYVLFLFLFILLINNY